MSQTWPAPQEVPETQSSLPPFSPDLLPEALRAWILDEAELANVWPETIAIPAIAALGSVIGRQVGLYTTQLGGYYEVPMLWGALISGPSTRKTSSVNIGTKFLKRVQDDLTVAYKAGAASRQAALDVVENDIGKLKQSLKKGASSSLEASLAEKYEALENLKAPEPIKIINDSTVESIGIILADNPNGLLYLKDELTGLLISMDKAGREGDRAFLLQSWNGKGSYKLTRVTRESIDIPALALSIFGGIQPGMIAPYVKGAIDGKTQADGLLQRFQLTIIPDDAPPYERVDRRPDYAAAEKALGIYRTLADLSSLDLNAEQDDRDPDAVPAMRFTPAAQERYNTWLDTHMPRLNSEALKATPAFQAHMAKYPSLVTRLSLVFHLVEMADGATSGDVGLEAVERAVAWAEYLEAHARKLYADELGARHDAVQVLVEQIKSGQLSHEMTLRDLTRKNLPGFRNTQEVKAALEALEQLDWLRVTEVPTGARPKKMIELNPELHFYATPFVW